MDTAGMLHELEQLNISSSELDIPEAQRIEMLTQMAEYLNSFINGLGTTKGYIERSVGDLRIQNARSSLREILHQYQEEVAGSGINAASPKHLGYIPGGGIFTSALADLLAAVTNPFASVHFASPGAATIENEVVNWLRSVFSFPPDSVGCLSSGGSISTLIALTAARDKFGIKNGVISKSVVYLGQHAHHSIQKALRIIGLEDVVVRHVRTDEHHRMLPGDLQDLIERDGSEGFRPFLIVATAGTTDTGAIDPLNDIADLAEQHGAWYHIDAAYGGFFILTSKRDRFMGIERANSLIIDPHKSLFMPYGVGAVLIKDADAVLHSNYYTANYMQDGHADGMLDSPANLSPELTKHFRGLRIWMPLQMHGVEPFVACLEEKMILVRYFRGRLAELGFQLGPEPDLSVSYFWYPFEVDPDEGNRSLMEEIHKDGSVFLSSSIINDRFVIRVAILAFRTKKETVDEAIEMIDRCLKVVLDGNRV